MFKQSAPLKGGTCEEAELCHDWLSNALKPDIIVLNILSQFLNFENWSIIKKIFPKNVKQSHILFFDQNRPI